MRAGPLALLALVVAAGGCSDAGLSPSAERGRQAYLAHCVACHNTDPAQPGALGPPVKGSSRELLEAKPYSFQTNGDRVLASGSFRLRGPDRLSEFQIHWVSEFEDGRLVRATSFAKRSQALEAIGLSESEAT